MQSQSWPAESSISQAPGNLLSQIREALVALEENRTDVALESLELAVAPTQVSVITHDIYGTIGAINKAKEEAEDALKDGNVISAPGDNSPRLG